MTERERLLTALRWERNQHVRCRLVLKLPKDGSRKYVDMRCDLCRLSDRIFTNGGKPMTEVINLSWRDGAYYASKPDWDGGAVVSYTDHLAEVQDCRTQALSDAAKAVCDYCRGTRGYQPVPVRRDGAWCHPLMVGDGSDPCEAEPIWDLLGDWLGREV